MNLEDLEASHLYNKWSRAMKLADTAERAFHKALPPECFISERKSFATDFGGTLSYQPAVVIMTRSEPETCTALRVAQETGTPVRIRGAGHSCFGQTLNDGGVVLFNHDENQVDMSLTDDLRLEAGGRMYWGNVNRRLKRFTATVPVLTDYLDLTVGGTLSVGGYGIRSVAHGSQADSVEAVRLIRPDGNAVWCSSTENPELFRFCFGSLGQVGVIERALVRVEELPGKVCISRRYYRNTDPLARVLESFTRISGLLPDHFWACITSAEILAEYGYSGHSEEEAGKRAGEVIPDLDAARCEEFRALAEYNELIHRMRAEWVESNLYHYRVWCDYMFDYGPAMEFLEFLSKTIVPRNLGVVYVLAVRVGRRTNAPLLPHNFSSGKLSPAMRFGAGLSRMRFGFGLYCMVPPGDAYGLARAKASHEECLDRCLALGGRPYRYGWCPLTEKEKERLYGPDLAALRALRKEIDPNGILDNGLF